MEISGILGTIVLYAKYYPYISIPIAIAIVGVAIWKPGKVLKVCAVFLAIIVVLYLASFIFESTKTGFDTKKEGISREY